MTDDDATPALALTAQIVASYVENNKLAESDLPELIRSVHQAIVGGQGEVPTQVAPGAAKRTKAQIAKSITPEGLISFIDGKRYQMLRRHLSANSMTPSEYRQQFGLPADYPMTSPGYSAKRSTFAKGIGLGRMVRTGRKAGG